MHVPDAAQAVRATEGPALAAARRGLADRTAGRVGSTGLLAAPCESRVLESALALRLLDLTGHTRARGDLARFLENRGRTEPRGTVDRVLADCAVTATSLPHEVVTSALAGFDHFTAGRKRNLLRAIAVVFGMPRTHAVVESHDRAGLHPWASTVATACEVIVTGRATAGQRQELLAALTHQGIWDGHLLCHLLSAHALRMLPGTDAVVTSAVQRLLGVTRPDGGVPFIESLNIFCTVVAGLGLMGVEGTDEPVHAIAERIADLQGAQGGWGYATRVGQDDVDTTAIALELLTAVDPLRYAPQIGKGMAFLHDMRGTDGGFPTYLRGANSEVAMTAAVANAIELDAAGEEKLAGTVAFIARSQKPDGSFEPGWSRSSANTLCRVLLALNRADGVLRATERAAARATLRRSGDRLVRDQNPDGGWGHVHGEESDPISTSFALTGLARYPGGADAVPVGLRYLLARQRPDGGFVSRPDSTGPRGFVYDVPVLADLYPLLAMAHLSCSSESGMVARRAG